MAHITDDRILESTTSTGTGALSLAGAVTGYRAFAGSMTVSDTCWYVVWGVDASGSPTGEWEVGLGTYSGTNTLTRTTVLESSTGTGAVSLSAGTKYVALTLTAVNTAQFDNAGAMWMPAASTEPPAPPSGVYTYAKQLLPGHTVLKVKRPSGVDSPLQDSVSFNRIVKYQGGPATVVAIGGGALTSATPSAVTPASGTTIRNALSRTQVATAGTVNAINSLYANAATIGAQVLRGSISGEGGFRVVMRFGLSVTTATGRFFAGLRDVTTAPTNIDPFTNTTPGVIGLASNGATDANWRIVHTLSGSTPTTIQLGANFPVNTTDLIELTLFCRPHNGSTAGDIGYRVRRYTTTGEAAFEATGTLSTNLPAGTTLLHPGMWIVNVTAAVVSFQVNSISIESDF